MRFFCRRIPLLAVLLAGLPAAKTLAQISPEPEVRRALPVSSSGATRYGLPQQEATPPIIMRAIPVNASPAPIPPATPFAVQTPIPQRVTAPIMERAPADALGSIRLAPVTARDPVAEARAQLAVADGFYARKEGSSAVAEYEKFLIMVPKENPDRERALYRLGESQRMMGSSVASERSFRSALADFPSGPLHSAVAFRLGELLENSGNQSEASDLFATAARDAGDQAVRQAATYHQALCLEKVGKGAAATALFQSLTTSPAGTNASSATNPYALPSLFRLAAGAAASGKKEEALSRYQEIITRETTPEARAEAALRSALLCSDLGRPEEARKFFATAAAAKPDGTLGETATLGLLRLATASGDDDAVLKSSSSIAKESPNRPEALLMRADALRRKGRHQEALELYDTLMREFPGSREATKAPFQRLLSLHATHSPNLIEEADHYLLTASEPDERARAQLLKAEATLAKRDYAGAAVLYGQIDIKSLPPSAAPDIVYKQAWSLLQAGDRETSTKALTRFLESFPQDERAPAALAQRATLRQEAKDYEGALADFDKLCSTYPKASERELALQQRGLLLGQLKRNDAMIAAFGQLLAEFPNSKAAPQAHYWLGWAAFEAKDYPKALAELSEARKGDPKEYAERAGIRILLAQYYQGDAAATAREAASLKPSLIPSEVGRWLGGKSLESGDKAAAERFLTPLTKEGLPGASDPDILAMLSTALTGQGKFKEAQAPAATCLKMAHDPASRAKALLVTADIQRALKNYPAARSQIEEAMLLQPEGPLNTQARILSGDLLAAQQDNAGAAKAYMTAALLDDGETSRVALTKATEAFRRAGNPVEEQKALEELRNRRAHDPVSSSTTPTR